METWAVSFWGEVAHWRTHLSLQTSCDGSSTSGNNGMWHLKLSVISCRQGHFNADFTDT